QFWTSTTMSTLSSSGEILVAPKTERIGLTTGVPVKPIPQSPNTNSRRSMLIMSASRLGQIALPKDLIPFHSALWLTGKVLLLIYLLARHIIRRLGQHNLALHAG